MWRSRLLQGGPAAFAALLLCAPALAFLVDSRSQIHAVIGQPLSVALPVSFAGINPSAVSVRVTPEPDLPDQEELIAASVQAVYDPQRSEVRLSTVRRVMVPTISLRVVVTAGTLVVNHDVDVLVDVPDLSTQHTARAEPAATPADAQPPAGEAPPAGIRVLSVQRPVAPVRQYGDAARLGSVAVDAARPSATPPPPPPPVDPRPKTWQVRPGETLSSISRRLAVVYEVPLEPMSLALYEANTQAFAAQAPEQAIAGRRLQVPEDYVVRSEPASRVAQFRTWLRQPLGQWQLRSFLSFGKPRLAPAPSDDAPQLLFARAIATVAGTALLLLIAVLLLRKLRLRPLVTRYVPMSAMQVQKVKRIIIPAPPPRRGLSQGTVTEKLRIKRLRDMLDHYPFRSDIRYRLAERLYKARDGHTFAQIAPPLRPSLSPEAWARVCAMGRELLPDDPRFQNPRMADKHGG